MPRKKKEDIIPESEISKDAEFTDAEVEIPDVTEPEDVAVTEAQQEEPLSEEAPDIVPNLLEAEPLLLTAAIEEPEIPKSIEDIRPESAASTMPKKKSFYELNLNSLDRNLTPEQAQEWNSIYASYRSRSILSGMVIGVDENRFEVSSGNGESRMTTIRSLIIIDYRVKILIPETEIWMPGDERPEFVLPSMVGSTIDYTILEVDREGECAIGSRKMALTSKRFFFARTERHEGERLNCKVVAVGPKVCTVECNGFDVMLTQRDLTYSAVSDLREKYRPGMELTCILKEYDKDSGKLAISVKEAQLNPFEGADKRHPVGSRRQAVISGKYRGGVFCTLPDGTVCHCLYSSRHSDADFRDGDAVIITIREFNYMKQQIFGRILSKW